MLKTILKEQLNKKHNGCQEAMNFEQQNTKVDAAASTDEFLEQLCKEETDSDTILDEAANWPRPEPSIITVAINPFTNPFFEYVTF
ncbi:hypothetical protein AVEN_119629-1 [Araneus ventricosus]|uniref:Uncharacterized protein n=1 Tax=Araneus ventricosus TaxID=182803 RepID=A0A4Y2WBZ2_ARAVE|nr:hypothetical protein AVEN_119629-1 [Araneus ventricosus]